MTWRSGNCRPTAQQELLLRAALLDDADACDAWAAWRATVDVEHIDEGSFRLLPLLSRNLGRLGVVSPLAPRLKGVHRQSWYRNQLLFRRMADTLNAFAVAGIDTMLLKGVPLALLHYRDEAVRPMADADILVKPSQLRAAVELLERCGWRPRTEPPAWPVEPRASWPFVDGERELDLHWRVFRIGSSSDDDLWAAAVPFTVRDATTHALAPADQLLHVLVHGLQWNPIPSIRWVADAAVVIRGAGDRFDWERLVEQAAQRRFKAALELGLGYLRDHLGVRVPARIMHRLEAEPPTRAERLELWSRMEPGVAGAACRLWFDYRRFVTDRGNHPGALKFRTYLRSLWLVRGDQHLPVVIASKIARRLDRVRSARAA